jgi:glycosyltransferase involved in cell wall biosynthesis
MNKEEENNIFHQTNSHLPRGGEGRVICFVANTTWYISNFKTTLLQYLEARGYEIYVVAPYDQHIGYLNQLKSSHHIPLHFLSRKGINPFQELRLFWEFYRIYKNLDCGIILHFTIKPNIYGTLAAWLAGKKSIMVIPGLGYLFIKKGFRRWITSWVYRLISPLSEKVIFENSADYEEFITSKIITKVKGLALRGVGVDTQYFVPMPKKRKDNKIIFTFLGRLIYEKGLREYYQAAINLKVKYGEQLECWIVGDIDNGNPSAIKDNELLQWIDSKAIRHIGHSADVREIIRDSDCVVLPSYYREGIPKVLQEGMSMEKPIITCDMPGCREAVEEGKNGFLVLPKNVESLQNTMEKVFLMPFSEREVMGKFGRNKAITEFDHNISNRIYEEVIEKLI